MSEATFCIRYDDYRKHKSYPNCILSYTVMYFCKLHTLRHVHSELLLHKMQLLDHALYIREDGEGLKCTQCQNIRYKCTLIDVLVSILMNFTTLT